MKNKQKQTGLWCRPAFRIALIFLIVSFLWILITDLLIGIVVPEYKMAQLWQTIKGWFFILLTSTLIYLLVRHEIKIQFTIEKKLSESQARYQQLFHATNIATAIISTDGKIIEANQSFFNFLEYTPDDLDETTLAKLVGSSADQSKLSDFVESNAHSANLELEILTKSGSSMWVNLYIQKIIIGEVPQYLGIANNITQQIKNNKEIENYQLHLKNLINDIFETEEREKRRLAVHLHDHFSQLLAIAKMKMSEFIRKNEHSRHIESLLDAKKYIDEALQKTRTLTYELSPPVLYELGLVNGMEWLINSVRENHHIEVRLFNKAGKISFNKEVEVIIYRIFSEMLTNVIKHAQAKLVLVYLEQYDNLFYLRVIDDGVGFDAENMGTNEKSFGLFSIRERIERLKGSFQIVSKIGNGTIIDISIPTI